MATFSNFFGIGKSQAELDFVNVDLDRDTPLFVDPFAISQRPDRWSQASHATLANFFQRIVDRIRAGDLEAAFEALTYLREPNETRLGFSAAKPQGAGIGKFQAEQLFDALRSSSAVQTGFITSLEECELMIEGIGRDKISDLTTNIIRFHLAEYTRGQCQLLGIPIQSCALSPYYDASRDKWMSDYFDLPVANGKPVLLVPKLIARYDLSYNHANYYDDFVISYLQAEALQAGSGLVRTLKDSGRKVVFKKEVKARFPYSKEFLFRFSKEHPEVLAEYRKSLAEMERASRFSIVTPGDETKIAKALTDALQSIPGGNTNATDYHNLIIGVLEFLLFPNLINPRKEQEIHQGRKRIDIVMENTAMDGVFFRLHAIRKLPCAFAAIECKNYTTEVANPEIDQLGGRFSPNRGQFGILCCRQFENRQAFIERCRDTFRDGRGLIVPLDDQTLIRMLALVANGDRARLDDVMTNLIDEVWYS